MSTAQASTLRRRLSTFVAPDVFDFWASRIDSTLSWNRPLARVRRVRRETADAVSIDLAANRHFAGLRPGQHLNLTVEIDGVRHTRSYSPTRISADARQLSITVREVEGGRVSRFLCNEARTGEVVELGAAFGDMTWPDAPQGRWLLLAAGSGITPMMSLIRSLAEMPEAQVQVDLLYWSRHRDTLCFSDELRQLAGADSRLRVHFGLTGDAATRSDEFAGRPQLEALSSRLPDLASRRVYACGPDGFVNALREMLGSSVQSFDAEAFTPPPLVESTLGTVRVHLLRSDRVLELPSGSALLPALEAQGLRPAHGCRMGLCNSCACDKRSGTTQNLVSGLSDSEANPALRLCVSRPLSDLTLDL